MKETAFEKFVKDFKNGPYTRVDLLFPNDNDVYFSFESKPPKKALFSRSEFSFQALNTARKNSIKIVSDSLGNLALVKWKP